MKEKQKKVRKAERKEGSKVALVLALAVMVVYVCIGGREGE